MLKSLFSNSTLGPSPTLTGSHLLNTASSVESPNLLQISNQPCKKQPMSRRRFMCPECTSKKHNVSDLKLHLITVHGLCFFDKRDLKRQDPPLLRPPTEAEWTWAGARRASQRDWKRASRLEIYASSMPAAYDLK